MQPSTIHLPTVSCGQNKVLPRGVLADQQVGISSIGAPAHAPIKKLLILEAWHEPRNRFSNGFFRSIWVGIGGMLGV